MKRLDIFDVLAYFCLGACIVLSVLAMLGCVRAPDLAPALRPTAAQQRHAELAIYVTCGEGVVDDDPLLGGAFAGLDGAVRVGHAVVLGPRTAVTAAHIVACAQIPRVWATTSTGRRLRYVVVHEDANTDTAFLRVASADWVDVAPPVLGALGGDGLVVRRTRAGDSGSGVYDAEGRLLGVVTERVWRGAGEYARGEPAPRARYRAVRP